MITKSNSKEAEKAFIDNIKKFFDNPEIILPECTDSCFMCPIKGYAKKIQKMKESSNFGKYHNSADQFLAGVSETYRILESEKAPLMGVIKTNYGSVNYCKRGNTDELIISGVQNYDNDIYRLLAFTNTVKFRGLTSSQSDTVIFIVPGVTAASFPETLRKISGSYQNEP